MSDAKKYSIYEAIPMITGAVAPIAKSKTNPQQNYKFRGIDDVYAALNLLLAKYGVSILPEVLESKHEVAGSTKSGSNMYRHVVRIRYHLFAADGSEAKADSEGEGMDTGDKATAKAFSMSFKTMAFQVFAIPPDEKIDAEEDDPEVVAAPAKTGKPPPVKAAEAPKDDPAHALALQIKDKILSAASRADLVKIDTEAAELHKARKINDSQKKRLGEYIAARLKDIATLQENAA